jgi:hypothetical protein
MDAPPVSLMSELIVVSPALMLSAPGAIPSVAPLAVAVSAPTAPMITSATATTTTIV